MTPDARTLDTAIADLPVGCTLMIYRLPVGYRVVLREDMPLRSWESAFIGEAGQLGEIVDYAITLQEMSATAADDAGDRSE